LNILLDKEYHCKISDFGLCITKKESTKTLTELAESCGTVPYMAPELLDGDDKVPFSPRSDVFALAIVFWELATHEIPFASHRDTRIIRSLVLDGERLEIPKNVPSGFRKLIKKCWEQEPKKRYTVEEIMGSLEKLTGQNLEKQASRKSLFSKFKRLPPLDKENLAKTKMFSPRLHQDKLQSYGSADLSFIMSSKIAQVDGVGCGPDEIGETPSSKLAISPPLTSRLTRTSSIS